MNLKNITITGILLFSVAALAYSPIGEAFAKTDIYIVNNLDVPLEFKEIKNREHIEIKSSPPDKVDAGETKSFTIDAGDPGNEHLNIKYYVNNSSSGEEVGIVYKDEEAGTGSGSCPKDHPDWMTEEVKHCGSWKSDTKEWQYIYTTK